MRERMRVWNHWWTLTVISAVFASVDAVGVTLERIELKLDKLDGLERRADAQIGALERIEALLRERLPRPG